MLGICLLVSAHWYLLIGVCSMSLRVHLTHLMTASKLHASQPMMLLAKYIRSSAPVQPAAWCGFRHRTVASHSFRGLYLLETEACLLPQVQFLQGDPEFLPLKEKRFDGEASNWDCSPAVLSNLPIP